MACRHYRAAYALDPAYKPAVRNLVRLTDFDLRKTGENIDYGDQPEEEVKSRYVIVYDDHHIGHSL